MTDLPCSFDDAVAQVKSPRLLLHVASPLVRFAPVDPPEFPQTWTEGTYWVRLKLFGVVPFGRQAVRISFPRSDGAFVVRDDGTSALIRTWDHVITITPTASGCRYEDRVTVSAGLLTPLVWAFAWVFYRHRQRRWRALARRGFDYGAG